MTVDSHEARRKRGLTIRLKLTIWTGLFFALAGALLIGVNYFMVHDSMTVAPGKVRTLIAERHGLDESDFEGPSFSGQPGQCLLRRSGSSTRMAASPAACSKKPSVNSVTKPFTSCGPSRSSRSPSSPC